MIIIDPGHIYKINFKNTNNSTLLKFVKRGGGAVQYSKEWPGVQTQAVMRALIEHLEFIQFDPDQERTYSLWQLGSSDTQKLILKGKYLVCELINVLIDRSKYLNNILECVETGDAITWLCLANSHLKDQDDFIEAVDAVRMALWCYEARAYRRKQEKVNRKQPAHDDSVSPKIWRKNPFDDVPFNAINIENRPIGLDGHLVL